MAQLGRVQVEEVRKLLGGDELPWALGKLYFTKGGKLKSIDLSRANPAINTITNFRAPKDVLGLLPPIAVAVLRPGVREELVPAARVARRGRERRRGRAQGYSVENRAADLPRARC